MNRQRRSRFFFLQFLSTPAQQYLYFPFCSREISLGFNYLIHSVQVPRLDAPRELPWSINLLKLLPRSQIKTPRPMNEQVFYPDHKETLSPVIFGKTGSPH